MSAQNGNYEYRGESDASNGRTSDEHNNILAVETKAGERLYNLFCNDISGSLLKQKENEIPTDLRALHERMAYLDKQNWKIGGGADVVSNYQSGSILQKYCARSHGHVVVR